MAVSSLVGSFTRCGRGDRESEEEEEKARQKALAEALILLSGDCNELVVSRQNLGDDAVARIADALARNSLVQLVQLDGNSAGKYAASRLAEALKENGTIKSLDLDCNLIGDEGAALLGTALNTNQSLRSLELHSNYIGCEGASGLSTGLWHNTSLRTLALNSNNIGNEGAGRLAASLTHNTTLCELNLGSNAIGDEGAAKLGDMLCTNIGLKDLHLESNQIRDRGAVSIANAIEQNSSLRELWLTDNAIDDDGLTLLTYCLAKNKGLQRLGLTLNMSCQNAAYHVEQLQKSHKLRRTIHSVLTGEPRVQLHNMELDSLGASRIAEAIESTDTIRELRLENCALGDEAALRLADALETNSSLEAVSLACNAIGKVGQDRLKGTLSRSTTLEQLDLDGNPGIGQPPNSRVGKLIGPGGLMAGTHLSATTDMPEDPSHEMGPNRNAASRDFELLGGRSSVGHPVSGGDQEYPEADDVVEDPNAAILDSAPWLDAEDQSHLQAWPDGYDQADHLGYGVGESVGQEGSVAFFDSMPWADPDDQAFIRSGLTEGNPSGAHSSERRPSQATQEAPFGEFGDTLSPQTSKTGTPGRTFFGAGASSSSCQGAGVLAFNPSSRAGGFDMDWVSAENARPPDPPGEFWSDPANNGWWPPAEDSQPDVSAAAGDGYEYGGSYHKESLGEDAGLPPSLPPSPQGVRHSFRTTPQVMYYDT